MFDLKVSVSHDFAELVKAYETLKYLLPQDVDICVKQQDIKEEETLILPLYVIIPQTDENSKIEKIIHAQEVLNVNEFVQGLSVTVFSVLYKETKRSIEVQTRVVHPEEIWEWYITYAEKLLPNPEMKMFQSQLACFSNLSQPEKEYLYSNLIASIKQRSVT